MTDKHGGDVEGYFEEYGCAPLDFSASINPCGLPESIRRAVISSAGDIVSYPDPQCRRLRRKIAEFEKSDPEFIVCGNGAADLIFRITGCLHPHKAVLPVPCFSEYERALSAEGCRNIKKVCLTESGFRITRKFINEIDGDTDIVFLCQPNNPTGLPCSRELLVAVAEKCRAVGSALVVDECFLSFTDNPDELTAAGLLDEYPNIIILKAFTKLFAMPGLRLGYAVCSDRKTVSAIANRGQPWAVSSIAQAAGIAALGDDAYLQKTRLTVRESKVGLIRGLTEAGAECIGGAANFVFFESDIPDLGNRLRQEGILIRDCSGFDGLRAGYFRAAVRLPADNLKLTSAIKRIRESE